MPLRAVWDVTRETVGEFVEDDAMTQAAALAYYTALGMSPLLVLLLWLSTFAGEEMQQRAVGQLSNLVGPQGGRAVQAIVENAKATPELGTIAGLVSLATLLFSVSGVFGQLQAALNIIWDVQVAPGTSTWWPWIRKRLLSLGTFLSVGFVLVVSLAVTALVTGVRAQSRDLLPGAEVVWEVITFAVSLGLSALLFALIFKVLPDVKLGWRDVVVGGVATAILFSIGRWLIALYLARSSIGSAYGAAGSLVVLLVWVYYASLVVFLGAELTQVLRRRRGGRIQPEEHAIKVEHRTEPQATEAPRSA